MNPARDGRPNRVFMDVGSTIIKYVRFDAAGAISDGGYFPRDYAQAVGAQAAAILTSELGWRPGHDAARICSSANGGLGVGVIGYTERFSARWAAKAAFNSGANVRWATTTQDWPRTGAAAVDLLVLAGGAEHGPTARQEAWLDQAKALPVVADAVVFAGNTALAAAVRARWPGAIIAGNVAGDDLRWQGDALAVVLREAYLRDLVQSKGLGSLQSHSEVPIMPTPAVVQESFAAILRGETAIILPAPLLLLDIGGATTDVFYGGELIADDAGSRPQPPINRHVFTHLGVSASRATVLERLSLAERLGEFLRVIDPADADRRYHALREGDGSWATPELLAEACLFLALAECASGERTGHRLALERVAAVCITGGASQLCRVPRLERIVRLCGARDAVIRRDDDYRIWIEGMARLDPLARQE
jgi:uncharacterized protein (TIGR01319 family)